MTYNYKPLLLTFGSAGWLGGGYSGLLQAGFDWASDLLLTWPSPGRDEGKHMMPLKAEAQNWLPVPYTCIPWPKQDTRPGHVNGAE